MIYAATADGDSNDDDNSDHMDDGQLLESENRLWTSLDYTSTVLYFSSILDSESLCTLHSFPNRLDGCCIANS